MCRPNFVATHPGLLAVFAVLPVLLPSALTEAATVTYVLEDVWMGHVISGSVVPVSMGCSADLDGSGAVDFADLLAILAAWGLCEEACAEDLDSSGDVGFSDLLAILSGWGPCG